MQYNNEQNENENVLEKYGRDIVALAREGKLIPLSDVMRKSVGSSKSFQEKQKIIPY